MTVTATLTKSPLIALVAANYLSWIGNTMTLVAVPIYVLDISGCGTAARWTWRSSWHRDEGA